MNRPIKFRMWDFEKRKMIYSDTCSDESASEQKKLSMFFAFGMFHFDFPITQFTGLLDKNGKEIYEGDVVTRGAIGPKEVKWLEHLAGWNIRKPSKTQRWPLIIIGNIYENPELLAPKK